MWAFGLILSSLPRLGSAQVKAFIFIACQVHDFFFMVVGLRAIDLAILLHCGYYSSVFPLMGLLAIILAMSTHFSTLFIGFPLPIYFFFISFYSHGLVAELLGPPFLAILLYHYLLLLLWAYWPLFMSCQPILPLYSLGFLGPFTYSLPLFTSLGLLLHSLGIISLFIFSLPLVIFMGLLAINPATPAHWACFLISLPFCPLFSSYLFYCWAFSAVRPFVKMGINNMYNACENSKKELYIIVHIYLIN